jgi:hypothetical protein
MAGRSGRRAGGALRDRAPMAEQPAQPGPPDDWSSLSQEEQAVLLKVADILKRIQFGTVVLVIQDGRVVQIEMAEKFRLR